MNVGVSEAARALGLSKGRVSPEVNDFVAQGLIEKDADGKFDLDRYKELRAARRNPLMARGRGPGLGYEPTLQEFAQAPTAAAVIGLAHADEKRIDAELKRLRLARERGEVADVADLAAIGAALGADWQEIWRRRLQPLAERLTPAGHDAALTLAALEEEGRAMFGDLAAAVAARIKEFERDDESAAA